MLPPPGIPPPMVGGYPPMAGMGMPGMHSLGMPPMMPGMPFPF